MTKPNDQSFRALAELHLDLASMARFTALRAYEPATRAVILDLADTHEARGVRYASLVGCSK